MDCRGLRQTRPERWKPRLTGSISHPLLLLAAILLAYANALL